MSVPYSPVCPCDAYLDCAGDPPELLALNRRKRAECPEHGPANRQHVADLPPVKLASVSATDASRPESGHEAGDPVAAAHIDAFLDTADDEYDWLVDGLLERLDRLILTGQEGKGKSTLLRQIAMQLAAGIHPFTLERITPVRVFLLDLENPRKLVRRKLRALRIAVGETIPNQPDDVRWLRSAVDAIRPDLLITGPLYKLAGGDPTEERTARTVTGHLDRLRVDFGLTLILEAHSPYGGNGGKRPERPYGASLWSRWPEFGLYLSPEGQLRHWRGPRDERAWPAALQRGGAWPWTPVGRERDVLWARIVELCHQAGDQLARRDLVELTGTSTGSVQRAIEEHRTEWNALGNAAGQGGGTE